jgi:pimeloyl-ACP methyl ester carboxylesterase
MDAPIATQHTVIFVHGIGLTHHSFWAIKRVLKKEHYHCMGITYPSLRGSIAQSADFLAQKLGDDFWKKHHQVSFVTHSLGGLVVATYLQNYQDHIPKDAVSSVIMIAPPLGGSQIADFWAKIPLYHFIFGKAGAELTTYHRQGIVFEPWYRLGIIAGDQSGWYPDSYFIFKEPHDGRVTIAHTKHAKADHVIVQSNHNSLLRNIKTIRHILSFLKTGKFL